ncbi:glycosyltransferase family 4 protein [Olivibacter sp. SDN3]|uniref:glycosyltransferase family 4 protein n=1 Tax=Olivibacter sp. SDN3 TaxID=2764720 RepID=UPI00165153BC|nr:glycosyltransferase family 4 protein [Olivibacter sp. SDN3]QNL47734.1 glycosyltransferase family 4 protein [Olivibacter sp. SDN3]
MTKLNSPKKILFITPFFGRTGSEILLLNLLKGLNREIVKPYLYSLRDGELLSELPADIPYFLPYNEKKNKKEKYLKSALKKIKIDPLEYQLKKIQKHIKADIWYLNTIEVSPFFLRLAKKMGVTSVTHFHELPLAYRSVTKDHLKDIIDYSTICIGCSKIVCGKIKELGHKNVLLQYSFIDTDFIDKKLDLSKRTEIRKYLKISSDEFVWIISGSVVYEKGLDYIPEILEYLENEKLKIIWLGKLYDNGLTYYVQTVLEKKWPRKVLFLDALTDDYYNYLSIGDALLMPSRQDSFSLVMLEAAYLGLPILSFNSGGVKEFVDEDKGMVINSWNAEDLALSIKRLMSTKTKKIGQTNNFVYAANHQLKNFHDLILNTFF